jgi:UDP-2,4-diacetamido-2,4,6-trideoxy-beta-L-altropyranose hydrolase
MKLVFLADSSPSIGIGHVMRTMTLAAEAVERGHDVVLHSGTLPPFLADRARRLRVGTVDVTADGWPPVALSRLAAEADLICFDGYDFGRDLIDTLRSNHGALMAIDDNREIPLDNVDMILNQNPHATPELYDDLQPRQLLVGPRFALVRDEVTALRSRRSVQSARSQIVVSMGGTDPAGLTVPLAEMLIDDTDLAIELAPGVDSSRANHRREFVARHVDRVTELRPDDLPAALARCDIALLAAGSTVWEAATLGVPTIALIVAENQEASARAAADRGALILSDARDGCDLAAVSHMVTALASDRDRRGRMTVAGRALIDGHGRMRVVRAIEALTGPIPKRMARHDS